MLFAFIIIMTLVITFRLSRNSRYGWLCDPQVLILSAISPGLITCSHYLLGFPVWLQLPWRSVSPNRTCDLDLLRNPWLLHSPPLKSDSPSVSVTQTRIFRSFLLACFPLLFFSDSVSHQGLPADSIFWRASETLLSSMSYLTLILMSTLDELNFIFQMATKEIFFTTTTIAAPSLFPADVLNSSGSFLWSGFKLHSKPRLYHLLMWVLAAVWLQVCECALLSYRSVPFCAWKHEDRLKDWPPPFPIFLENFYLSMNS